MMTLPPRPSLCDVISPQSEEQAVNIRLDEMEAKADRLFLLPSTGCGVLRPEQRAGILGDGCADGAVASKETCPFSTTELEPGWLIIPFSL